MARGVEGRRKTPFVVTAVDDAVLRAVYEFHYVTAEQVGRLRYSPRSITHVRERLRRLYDAGYLLRFPGPRAASAGQSEQIYRLDRRGIQYFDELGFETQGRFRPSDHRMHGGPFILHTLAINDVLIAARALERLVSDISIETLKHEQILKRRPVSVNVGKSGEQVTVIGDAWIDFRIRVAKDEENQYPVWLELDRGTEPVRRFKQKMRALVAYHQGPYASVFGTSDVAFAFAVDQEAFASERACEKRVAEIHRWSEEELADIGRKSYGEVFLFGVLPARTELNTTEFFLAPVWSSPYQQTPLPLLPLPKARAACHEE